jgi:hypothetical protein
MFCKKYIMKATDTKSVCKMLVIIYTRKLHSYYYTIKNLRDLSLQANYTDRATALVGEVCANFCG